MERSGKNLEQNRKFLLLEGGIISSHTEHWDMRGGKDCMKFEPFFIVQITQARQRKKHSYMVQLRLK